MGRRLEEATKASRTRRTCGEGALRFFLLLAGLALAADEDFGEAGAAAVAFLVPDGFAGTCFGGVFVCCLLTSFLFSFLTSDVSVPEGGGD